MNILNQYACLLLDYCLAIKKGEKLYVVSTTLAEPLVREVYREAIKRGAHVEISMTLAGASKIFYDHANEDQLLYVNPVSKLIYETFDAYLHIRAPFNLREDQNVDKEKQRTKGEAGRIINDIYSKRTADGSMRRCLCQYPTQASAQEAGMSLEEYEDFVYTACKLDTPDPIEAWKALGRDQQKIVDHLNQSSEVRYVNEKTDISFSVKDRVWINSDGKANMPSGEVFTGPVEETVNGTIHFDFPSIFRGHEIKGITLEVKDGVVIKWNAEVGGSLLDDIFATEGANMFGEVAIGTNYNIQKATKNILFDEKIGGSVHMAIGQSYIQTGGKNNSQIHWDMIANMRNGGKIFTDGKLIYENGLFLGELSMG